MKRVLRWFKAYRVLEARNRELTLEASSLEFRNKAQWRMIERLSESNDVFVNEAARLKEQLVISDVHQLTVHSKATAMVELLDKHVPTSTEQRHEASA